ncbi:MAG: CoA pyrophosphatase [Acidobacteria bacterium]|nr:CoA pyrophosphatase [Acidobacteriota bacterium]
MSLQETIRSRLVQLPPRTLRGGYTRESAVLMPIFEQDGQPHFLLTLRTEDVRTHKGQISFPGGMKDGQETLEETALRETLEEIGIERSRLTMLGRFHDYLSINSFRVAPFAAYLESPFAAAPRAGEVAEILPVPFAVFREAGGLRVERMFRRGAWIDVYFYRYRTHEIWGLTARIIKDFLEELQLPGDM